MPMARACGGEHSKRQAHDGTRRQARHNSEQDKPEDDILGACTNEQEQRGEREATQHHLSRLAKPIGQEPAEGHAYDR
jgi:hypothetical protein